jgi:alpha-1,6-mannosyltransferase
LKIVDISEFYSPTSGGVRTYVEEKFKAAERNGHSLAVIAPGPEDSIERRGEGQLIWVKSPQLPFDTNYHMFIKKAPVWRILDKLKPDFLEGSSPWRGGWIAGTWPGSAPRALFMHADPVAVYPQMMLESYFAPDTIDTMFSFFWRYLRRLNDHYNGCIVAGQWLASRFSKYGLKNLHTVPFGIDSERFSPAYRNESLRQQMLTQCGLGPEALLVIIIGRHHPEKRVEMLIDAVTLAQRTRQIGLFIIGDGLFHKRICRKASQTKHVHIAGRVDDRELLAGMTASADALLHGSTSETFGFVVAESLVSGTPVITPRAGGAGELSSPQWAEIYKPGSASDAANALLRLAARERTSLSEQAYQAGLRLGSMEHHFERLFELYASMRKI